MIALAVVGLGVVLATDVRFPSVGLPLGRVRQTLSPAAGLFLHGRAPAVGASLLNSGTLTSEVDGIRVELTSSPSRPGTKAATEYVVHLADGTGQPVIGARVTVRGGMADGMSVVAPLRPAKEPGMY